MMRTAAVYRGRITDGPQLKTLRFPKTRKPSSKRRILTQLTYDDSSSSEELFDEGSGDKWETSNNPAEINDHSYLCVQKNETSLLVKRLEVPAPKLDKLVSASKKDPVHASNAFKENVTPLGGLDIKVPEPSAPGRVKKKRGRKPGSKVKRNNQASKHFYDVKEKIYYSPTLKHPERYPNLVYFKDDSDDEIFIRNTSRDVMLSSTLPFQETPEFHMLKVQHLKNCYRSKKSKN